LDQAVWYVHAVIQGELDKAGHKKQKGEGAIISARKRVLAKYLDGPEKSAKQFADPAVLFGLS